MNYSNQALSVFVTTQIINISALITDYILIKINLPSISDISVKYPVIGLTIIAFQCISPVSISLHFFFLEPSKV